MKNLLETFDKVKILDDKEISDMEYKWHVKIKPWRSYYSFQEEIQSVLKSLEEEGKPFYRVFAHEDKNGFRIFSFDSNPPTAITFYDNSGRIGRLEAAPQ